MAFQMPQSAGSRAPKTKEDLIPSGLHIARCYGVIDLGTQKGTTQFPDAKGNMRFPIQRKVLILWELPEIKKVFDKEKGEQPVSVRKKYTYAFSDKSTLFKDFKSWFSEKPDGDMAHWLSELTIGRTAFLNISQKEFNANGETVNFNAIESVNPLPPKTKCPAAINSPIQFDMFSPFDEEKFKALPEWIQKEIQKSPEYGKAIGAALSL